MSLADVEIVMDGPKPRRVIVTSADGVAIELPGVRDVSLEMPVGGPPELTVRMIVTPTVRALYEEEQ